MQARIKDIRTTQLFCPAAVSRGISIKSCWLQLKAQSSHEVARELVHHDSHMASYKFLRAGANLRTIYLSLSRRNIAFSACVAFFARMSMSCLLTPKKGITDHDCFETPTEICFTIRFLGFLSISYWR